MAGVPAADLSEDYEKHLQAQSDKQANPMAKELIKQLSSALVYTDASNAETNRKLWDAYAKDWGKEQAWVTTMVGHLPLTEDEKREHLVCVGDEWSDKPSLQQVVQDFIEPNIAGGAAVAEIGSGGGRISRLMCRLPEAHRPGSLRCFDISMEMLKRAKAALDAEPLASGIEVAYTKLPVGDATAAAKDAGGSSSGGGGAFAKYAGTFDFVVCFDVMVHMDMHTIWQTIQNVHRILKPGAKAFLSTSDITAPGGWARFEKQRRYTVGGFFFVSPDAVRHMVTRAGLNILLESPQPEAGGTHPNIYYNRDFLFLVEKPGPRSVVRPAKLLLQPKRMGAKSVGGRGRGGAGGGAENTGDYPMEERLLPKLIGSSGGADDDDELDSPILLKVSPKLVQRADSGEQIRAWLDEAKKEESERDLLASAAEGAKDGEATGVEEESLAKDYIRVDKKESAPIAFKIKKLK